MIKELSHMKKFICLLTVLLMMTTLVCPVFAAEGFVPSISDKEEPDIVVDDEGVAGIIRGEDGEIVDKVPGSCLVITPISEAETSTEIPEDSRKELLYVYKELLEGDMTLPYEEDGLDPDTMVIRDLIDASWLCEEHPEMLEPEGVTIDLTFDIGVDADTKVYVYVYIDGEWTPVPVVNNGDGTVTCTFEKICPIAFCVAAGTGTPPAQTGDTFSTAWVVLMVASAAALVAAFSLRRKVA
jgi:hypothetical protein